MWPPVESASSGTTRRSAALLLVFLQVAFWIAALIVVSRVQVRTGRRTGLVTTDETLIDLSAEPVVDPMLDRSSNDDDVVCEPDRANR